MTRVHLANVSVRYVRCLNLGIRHLELFQKMCPQISVSSYILRTLLSSFSMRPGFQQTAYPRLDNPISSLTLLSNQRKLFLRGGLFRVSFLL